MALFSFNKRTAIAGAKWLMVMLIISAAGCSQLTGKQKQGDTRILSDLLNPVQLRGELDAVLNDSYAIMIGRLSMIAANSKDSAVRELTLRAKIDIASSMQHIQLEPDPRAVFVYLWVSIAQRRFYFTDDFGRDVFGDQQQLLIETLNELEQRVMRLGRRYFGDEAIDEAREEIEALARSYVRGYHEVDDRISWADLQAAKDKDAITAVLGIPMAPVDALQGVGDTATELRHFSQIGLSAVQVIKEFPEITRWQLELLMYEFEDLQAVIQALEYMGRFVDSFESIAQSIDTMPQDMRSEFELALETVDQSSENVQASLAGIQEAAKEIHGAFEQIQSAAREVSVTAQELKDIAPPWQQAAQAADELLASYAQMQDGRDPTSEPVTPAELMALAQMSSALVGDVRTLLNDINQPLAETSSINQAASNVEDLMNALTLRAIALVVIIFATALLYRRITRGKLRG